MQVRTEITPEELKQAIRLNRNKRYWLNLFLANWYATILLIVILWAEIARIVAGKPIQLASLWIVLIPVFFLWLYWYRTQSSISKAASELSDTAGSASLDSDGIHATASTGATSFIPWSQYSAWKESTEVFTLTTGKTFRVFSKRGLSESEVGQLRSLFQSQVN